MDVAIAWIADRQHGVISLRQMQLVGLTASGVRNRVASGRLHRQYNGVYSVGHRHLTREGRWMAAVLACGDDSALSHRSAAALRDIRRSDRRNIDVTSPRGRSRKGVDVHRGRLTPEDVTIHNGIPVTTVARTLVDLADVLTPRDLRRAVEQAERCHLLDVAA